MSIQLLEEENNRFLQKMQELDQLMEECKNHTSRMGEQWRELNNGSNMRFIIEKVFHLNIISF